MKQNVYDDPRFFEAYRKLRDREGSLNDLVEEPAFLTVLPDLEGLDVLDLGSGFGDFCRQARSRGASTVRGVEISRRMIDAAKNRTKDAQIDYVNVAIEDYKMPAQAYDVVVSRLTFHYVRDFVPVVRAIHGGLRTGGIFAFSIEHPICTALCEGWYANEYGEKILWPVDNYSIEGERTRDWFINDVIKYHRTVETYVNALLDSGFAITRLLEPHIDAEQLKKQPGMKDTLRRPSFLILAASKR